MAEKKKAQEQPEIEGEVEVAKPSAESIGEPEAAEVSVKPSGEPETASRKFIVRNMLREAIQMHLYSGTITIPPRGRAEVTEKDVYSPHLRSLERQGIIAVSG